MLERPGADLGLGSVSGRRLKQRGLFPFQEFIPSPDISSEGGWFWLLLNWLLSFGVQGRGGVHCPLSRAKAKLEPTVRENLKAKPWLISVWQRSRHLEARADSFSPTAVILVYF